MPLPPMLASPATLPPFVGNDPAIPAARSPYNATMEEIIQRFGTTTKRREILAGLIAFRREIRRLSIGAEFQWVAGSFVEKLGREPNDVDVVTFYTTSPQEMQQIQADPVRWADVQKLANRASVKGRFQCDAFFVSLSGDGRVLVNQTHYWYGLFSHQRGSLAWKGMVQIDVASFDDDTAAESILTAMVP